MFSRLLQILPSQTLGDSLQKQKEIFDSAIKHGRIAKITFFNKPPFKNASKKSPF